MIGKLSCFSKVSILFVAIAIMIASSSAAFAQNNGVISGKIIDEKTGDPLIGVTIILKDTKLGARTDVKGSYQVRNVPPGVYSLNFRYIGYNTLEIPNVSLAPGQVRQLDISLKEISVTTEEVVVTAEAIKSSEGGLLRERQKSSAVSDAISSDMINKTGASSVADAMDKVTGVSVVDGKYIYVRGLGDRYSNTQLNGAQLASSDPDRNSVSTDIFSSNFIENIVTIKSFTPDKPGNFTGGSVDIRTKNFPEKTMLSFSVSSSYNTQANLNDNFLGYNGGATDWLGIDDGTRNIPSAVNATKSQFDGRIPSLSEARTNPDAALLLDNVSKSFTSQKAPENINSGMNSSYSLSYGDQGKLFGNTLGFVGALNYSRGFNNYTNGFSAQWQLTGKVAEKDQLDSNFYLRDSKSSVETNWGAMANLSYKIGDFNQLSFNFLHNRNGNSESRYVFGTNPRDLPSDFTYETRTLDFVERGIYSYQFSGEHFLKSLGDMQVDWNATTNSSYQDQPDLRYFTNEFVTNNDNGVETRNYFIDRANYEYPQHFYRDMTESIAEGNLNITMPFRQWSKLASKLKFGGSYNYKDRDFNESRFEFRQTPQARYEGDAETFFAQDNLGIIGYDNNNRPIFGNYIVDVTQLQNSYTGSQSISAGYLMVDMPLIESLRLVAGARYETTNIETASKDTSKAPGVIDVADALPSINLIYNLQENMNLRASVGRTLARPTFRELAPFPSFDFIGGFILNGNPNLKRTLVNNYDLRWEWFQRPGEIIAVSAFYKDFHNPIENAIVSNNNQSQFQNVDNAIVMGLEFEFRSSLNLIDDALSNFFISTNLTIVDSKVDIPAKELAVIKELNPEAGEVRNLQGQSPYILNANFEYSNYETGSNVNLVFNIFGKRLSRVSIGGTPNVFEQPRGMLDLIFSQRVLESFTIKITGQNLLDAVFKEAHEYKGRDYSILEYRIGRTFSIGMSYNL